jgi:NAD(P)-dependent dehydrogenase (short-subunit alcohol dehydrogenase family)
MTMKLGKKIAIITGAGTGIGRACAELFAGQGAAVVLAGRRQAPLEEVREAIEGKGGRALAAVCDVRRSEQVRDLVGRAESTLGGLNIVVNNAALWIGGTAEDTSETDWDAVMETNLKGAFLVSREALPALRRAGGGTIVNIGSVLGLVGMKQRVAYATSKGGLVQMTKAMALDHAAEKIRVNCVCPSLVHTPMGQDSLARFGDADAELARRIAMIPLGRAGTPEDVARLALFLASDDSNWITGAAIPLDGGFSAG